MVRQHSKKMKKHFGKNDPKARAQQIDNRHNTKKTIRVFVAGGSRSGSNPEYVREAFNLGLEIGRHDYQLTFGLSSHGIMGAVAKGVLQVWTQKDNKTTKPIQGITTEHYQSLYPEFLD